MSSKQKCVKVEGKEGAHHPVFEVANVRVIDGELEYLVQWHQHVRFDNDTWQKEDDIAPRFLQIFKSQWDSAIENFAETVAEKGTPPPHSLKTKQKQRWRKAKSGVNRRCPRCSYQSSSDTDLFRHKKECLENIQDLYFCVFCNDHFEDSDELTVHVQHSHFSGKEIELKEGLVLFPKGTKLHLRYGRFDDTGSEDLMHFPTRSWKHLETLMCSKSLRLKTNAQSSNVFVPFYGPVDEHVTCIIKYQSDKCAFIIDLRDLMRNLMENFGQGVAVVFFIMKTMIEYEMNEKLGLSVSLCAVFLKGDFEDSFHTFIKGDPKKHRLTFIPICTPESNHFVLVIIDDEEKEIRLYDSCPGRMKNTDKLVRDCAKKCEKRRYKIVEVDCKNQRKNENSCAYYVFQFAFNELKGLKKDKQLKLCEIRQLKLLIFKEICSRSEIGVNLPEIFSDFLDFPDLSYLSCLSTLFSVSDS